jgi:Fic family protein
MRSSASKPPFTVTPLVMNLSLKIAELMGRWNGASRPKPRIQLRRENQLRTVQASLAIEGNTLTLNQISALLDKKRVIGPKKDVLEAQNALRAYEQLSQAGLSPHRERDFLKIHSLLMIGLATDAGKYRAGNVGILKGTAVSHVAPSAKMVPELMQNLFEWLKTTSENPLFTSCIAHYEIEFIHPFSDGNGRMGRLWHHFLLQSAYPIFEFVPIETVIRKSQLKYYTALEKSDRAGDATLFLEYALGAIHEALEETIHPKNFQGSDVEARLEKAKHHFGSKIFSRSEYMMNAGQISSATASRDLQYGALNKILKTSGKMRMTKYQFTLKLKPQK